MAILRDAERRGNGNDIEFRIVRKDGLDSKVAISWQSLTKGRRNRGLPHESVRDIHERKRMEEELRNLRKRAESAVIARSNTGQRQPRVAFPGTLHLGLCRVAQAGSLDAQQNAMWS